MLLRLITLITLALALTASVGCRGGQALTLTSGPDTSQTSSLPGNIAYFPVALDKYAGTPYPAALVTGNLTLYQGCLRAGVGTADNPGHIIVWPAGFSVREENGSLQVSNKDHAFTVRLRDRLDFGGGQVPSEIVEKYTGQPAPAQISGTFWLTGSVHFTDSSKP